jgi:hypothetical protein
MNLYCAKITAGGRGGASDKGDGGAGGGVRPGTSCVASDVPALAELSVDFRKERVEMAEQMQRVEDLIKNLGLPPN